MPRLSRSAARGPACLLRSTERSALMHALELRYHAGTMRVFFRFILWLSITVLCLQGGAAMAIEQAGAPAHDMVATTDHARHHAASQSGGDHCSESCSKAPASMHAKCPTCASCCVGSAAPPAQLPGFHAPSAASSPHVGAEAAMTSFVPSTLERPPRGLFV
jgi:hypothetical protein